VLKVKAAIFDPFEYLMLRNKDGKLKTKFANTLGKIAYQIPCHLRVQNLGQKTREALQLVPDTKIDVIERCTGHDGTYAVKAESHEFSMKILKPVVGRVQKAEAQYYSSDCPMAGRHIQNGLRDGTEAVHPMSLLRKAYGI
jgi:Fe-S oxidoreductase